MYEKQMELFEDGGLRDEGGMVDEESGNEVPVGSTRKEVRDDIPAMLSEGEFVFPADVVRYIGLENLMRMRQDAKQGLKRMDAMGQMGNGDEATMPDDLPFGVMDLIIVEGEEEPEVEKKAQGGVVHMNEGGFTTNSFRVPKFDPSNQDVRQYENAEGKKRNIPFFDGKPLYPIPEGYFPVGTVEEEIDETKEAIPTGGDDDTPPPPQSEFQKAGGWDMDTSATDGKALDMWIKEAEKVSTFGNVAAGIGVAINPLFGGMIALANKNQKKQIIKMLDEKIAQAKKTPIKGQVAALQEVKDRLTNPERKNILAKIIDEVTGTVTDSLGLSEEEKVTAKVGASTNTKQTPSEPDSTTEAAVARANQTVEILKAAGIDLATVDGTALGTAVDEAVSKLGVNATPEELAAAVKETYKPETPETPESGVQLEVGPSTPVAPVAPETPEAIPTAPELPVDLVASALPKTPKGISVPTDSPFKPPEEGETPSTLPLRTEQAVVGAGMTKIQTALDEIRKSMPRRGPVSGMTIEEKLKDPIAPFQKGWQALTDAISEVSTTDYKPPTQPTPTTVSTRGGDDDDPFESLKEMQNRMESERQSKQESAKQAAKDIAQEAKDTGKSIAEVGRERAPSSESKNAAEKAKEEGDPRNMKSGGLASRKNKKK